MLQGVMKRLLNKSFIHFYGFFKLDDHIDYNKKVPLHEGHFIHEHCHTMVLTV